MPRRAAIPGLIKRGDTYWAQFRYKGERIRKSLSKDRQLAEEMLVELRARIQRGDWSLIDNQCSLAPIVDQYLQDVQHKHPPNTAVAYRARLNRILPHVPLRVTRLRHQNIIDYRAKRLAEGISPGSINDEVTALLVMLNWAVNAGMIGTNPIAKVGLMRHQTQGARALDNQEVEALLKGSPERWARLWYCMLTTGLRRSEVCYLRQKHVDWASREILVSADLAKGSRPRRLPIDQTLWGYLCDARVMNPEALIFGVSYTGIPRALGECCNLATIDQEKVSCHSLRKTFCVGLFRAGSDPEVVRELMGHKSVAITLSVYRSVAGVDRQTAIAGLPWGSGGVATPDGIVRFPVGAPRGECTDFNTGDRPRA